MPVEGVVLPDPLTVAHQVLVAGLAPAKAFTELPVDFATRPGFVLVSAFTGGGVSDPRFAARTNLQVDAYASDRQAAAALAASAVRVLLRAHLRATRVAEGVLSWVEVASQPAPFPGDQLPEKVRRYIALFTITARP